MKRNLFVLLLAAMLVSVPVTTFAQDASSADPLRVDPTGTTSQPVDDNAGSLTIDNAALSVVGGGVEATALRVTIASDSTGLLSIDDNGGAISVDDDGGSLTIDNASLSVTGGGVEAGTLRVTIANDSTGLLSIDDNGASLTIDNSTLAVVGGGAEATALRVTMADDSTGLLSIDDNGASLTVDNSVLSVVGGGVEATAQRVTIASDSTGLLSIDDNGGSITVDGTVSTSPAAPNQTYIARVVAVPAASEDYLSIFNAAASGRVIRITRIEVESNHDADINGGQSVPYNVAVTDAIGATNCTAVTINPIDSDNAAVVAGNTALSSCDVDPTVDFSLFNCVYRSEENPNGGQHGKCYTYNQASQQPITLREGEGLLLQQTAFSNDADLDSIVASIEMTIETT